MKALFFIFSVLLILLLAGLWIGSGSYPDRWRMENEISAQKVANQQQKEKNRKIQAELDDLASGDDAIEERARSELGMTKKGETFYEVVLQPEPKDTHNGKALESQKEPEPVKNKIIKLLDSTADNAETKETGNASGNDESNDKKVDSKKTRHKTSRGKND